MKIKHTFIGLLFLLNVGVLWGAKHSHWVGTLLTPEQIHQAERDLEPGQKKLRHLCLPGGALLGRFSASMQAAIDERLSQKAQECYSVFLRSHAGTCPIRIEDHFYAARCVPMTRMIGYFGNVDAVSTGSIVAALTMFRGTDGRVRSSSEVVSLYDQDGQSVFSISKGSAQSKKLRSAKLKEVLQPHLGEALIRHAAFDADLNIYSKASNDPDDDKGTHFSFARDQFVLDACLASCALPELFEPHKIDGLRCYDLGRFRGNHPVYKTLERISFSLEAVPSREKHMIVNLDTAAYLLPDLRDSMRDTKITHFVNQGKLEFINVFIRPQVSSAVEEVLRTKNMMGLLSSPYVAELIPLAPLLQQDLAIDPSRLRDIISICDALVKKNPDGSFSNPELEKLYKRIEAWMVLNVERELRALYSEPCYGYCLDSVLNEPLVNF